MKKRSMRIMAFFFFYGMSPFLHAVTPISYYMDLVAGEGDKGYRDGLFTSALFNAPAGAAFSRDKTKVYIADSLNDRVRVIDLADNNHVYTLTGKQEPGQENGSFADATFDHPTLIAVSPDNQIIVYDSGSARLRLIDLTQKTVSTLGKPGLQSVPQKNTVGIYGMVFDPKTKSLYFTQPALHALKKWDIQTGEITTVLENRPELPSPAAICFWDDQLCVADQTLPSVYGLEGMGGPPAAISLKELGKGEHIAALAGSDGILYALQSDIHLWARVTGKEGFAAGPITVMSSWGTVMEKTGPELSTLFNFNPDTPSSLLAFPDEPRKFLWVSPNNNAVFTLRDYAYFEYKNTKKEESPPFINGLTDFAYPSDKPPQTYRILLMGDSLVFYGSESDFKNTPGGFNRWETLPKRIEAFLNMEASLDNVPIHYQVLTLAQYAWENALSVWPYYLAPDVIKKFDIDAVFLLQPANLILSTWYNRPYTNENIPDLKMDPEFWLQPLDKKLLNRDLEKDVYERCLKNKWVPKGRIEFEGLGKLAGDPQVLEDLTQMISTPYRLLNEKMKTLKTKEGAAIPYRVLFVPLGSVGANAPIEVYRNFYKAVGKRSGVDLEDLTDPWTALKISLYPTSEFGYMFHFDHNGNAALAYLITHEMIKNQWIPFGLSSPKDDQLKPDPKGR